MACPFASSARAPPLFPSYLRAQEISETHPFSHPHTKEEDMRVMREGFPRILSIISTLIAQRALLNAPDAATKAKDRSFKFEFSDGTRFLIPSLEKLLESPKFFMIGFFGFKLDTSSVTSQIWALDDKLLAAIPSFPGITAYITMRKPDGQYYNYVFLDNFELVKKWRGFAAHEAAMWYSPWYYSCVRINHGVLPCSIQTLIDNPAAISRLEFVRTKCYEFRDGKMTWTAIRTHKTDDVFKSLTDRELPRPITFASFLGDNAFQFYSSLVEYIGKTTGLPVKMIDVAALTKGSTPRPADVDSISLYNIDFAFTCGITYVNSSQHLVPLAAPVRVESRYHDRPIYYADIIVKSDSSINTIEDLQGKSFVINERVSLSGHLMPQLHFQQRGGLDTFFGTVKESGSHANSIVHVIEGKADAAGIDSVVLDMEFAQKPERINELRIIESTAPATMPPFVAAAWVPTHLRNLIANALTHAHTSRHVAPTLRAHGFARFARVEDADYEPVRRVRAAYNPHK